MTTALASIDQSILSIIFSYLDADSIPELVTTAQVFASCPLDIPLKTAQVLVENHPYFYKHFSKRVQKLVPQALIYRPENIVYAPLTGENRHLYIHLLALLKLKLNDFEQFLEDFQKQISSREDYLEWQQITQAIAQTSLPQSVPCSLTYIPKTAQEELKANLQAAPLTKLLPSTSTNLPTQGGTVPLTFLEVLCSRFPICYHQFEEDWKTYLSDPNIALTKIREKGFLIYFCSNKSRELIDAACSQSPVWRLLTSTEKCDAGTFDEQTLSNACAQFPKIVHYFHWESTSDLLNKGIKSISSALLQNPFLFRHLHQRLRAQPLLIETIANSLHNYSPSPEVDQVVMGIPAVEIDETTIKQLALSSSTALRLSSTIYHDIEYLLRLAPLHQNLIYDLPDTLRCNADFLLKLLETRPTSWPAIMQVNQKISLDDRFIAFAKTKNLTEFSKELSYWAKKLLAS